MTAPSDIIIIGSGMAAYTLLREIRKINSQIGITLICQDSGDFYSKPMLSNALDKQKTPDQLITQTAEAMVTAQGFELINHCKIERIDAEQQQVHSHNKSWNYNKLILATGARPFTLPVEGDAASDVLSVNNLDDYRAFYQKLNSAQHIAIIGPGLIGCEFANDLINAQKQVSVIGPDAWPISNLLPETVGHFAQQKLQQQGIQFYLENTVQSINKTDEGYLLNLQDQHTLEADLIVSAVGLRANLDLSQDNGLNTQRGYITDRFLQTSIDNIYALGDCAEVAGLHLPYIMPIMSCARALAKTLTGEKTSVNYPAMPVVIKTPACPLVVAPPPAAQKAIWKTTNTETGIKALAYSENDLTGFALAGDAVAEKQSLIRMLPPVL